ncbi:MAG: 30S ribosomal protein S6 [Candidatus Omnitrophica bacterium]|nr:30S ribosomal protein S6 [Candidatus Omnitrophota bacterium]
MSGSVKDYEAVLVISPELNEEGVSKLQQAFEEAVGRHGGKILEAANNGKRKLSYRIGKLTEGIYLQIRLQLPPSEISNLKKTASLMEQTVRFLVVRGGEPQKERSIKDSLPSSEPEA